MDDAEFDALRDSLHEYDPTVIRCRGIVHATGHETDGFEEPYSFTYEATCVRPRVVAMPLARLVNYAQIGRDMFKVEPMSATTGLFYYKE